MPPNVILYRELNRPFSHKTPGNSLTPDKCAVSIKIYPPILLNDVGIFYTFNWSGFWARVTFEIPIRHIVFKTTLVSILSRQILNQAINER
jgi:hypothetical protein